MFDSLFPKEWTTLQRLMWLKTNALARAVYETITGNPVSFTAKAAPLRQLEVAFSPVQDLHGYDAPWPAGGGANKWDEEWEEGSLTWGGDNYPTKNKIRSKGYIPVTPETTYYAVTPANIQIFYYDANKTFVRYAPSSLGNTSFTIPADCYYMRFYTYATDSYPPPYNHDIAINYPSSVTTYSPYSNLCPILGWDSLNVEQRGKNLLHGTEYAGSFYNVNAGTSLVAYASEHASYTQSGNEITVNTITAFYGVLLATDVLPAGKYHVHCDSPTVTGSAVLRDSVFVTDKDLVTVGAAVRNWANLDPLDVTVTLTEPSRIAISLSANTSNTQTVYKNLQVELGESYTEWQAYNPLSRSISISLGSTVYSGTLDVVTGVGEVTMAGVHPADYLSTASLTSVGNGYSEGRVVIDTGMIDNAKASQMKCDSFKYGSWGDIVRFAGFNNQLYFKLAGEMTLDEWKAEIGTINPFVVYPRRDPLTIQLTPQEVQSLAGDNTMWTDGDSLEVTYRSN